MNDANRDAWLGLFDAAAVLTDDGPSATTRNGPRLKSSARAKVASRRSPRSAIEAPRSTQTSTRHAGATSRHSGNSQSNAARSCGST